MNNLFAQSRSHWVRYDRYKIKTGKDGKRYITPEKTAKPDVYNPLKESSEMVLEALNVGMLMMNRSPEDAVWYRFRSPRDCWTVICGLSPFGSFFFC